MSVIFTITAAAAVIHFLASSLSVAEDAGVAEVCTNLLLPPGIAGLGTTITVPLVATNGTNAGS